MAATCRKGFLFSVSSLCLPGQHCSCRTAQQPVELSENMLQNLFYKLPPPSVCTLGPCKPRMRAYRTPPPASCARPRCPRPRPSSKSGAASCNCRRPWTRPTVKVDLEFFFKFTPFFQDHLTLIRSSVFLAPPSATRTPGWLKCRGAMSGMDFFSVLPKAFASTGNLHVWWMVF